MQVPLAALRRELGARALGFRSDRPRGAACAGAAEGVVLTLGESSGTTDRRPSLLARRSRWRGVGVEMARKEISHSCSVFSMRTPLLPYLVFEQPSIRARS